VATVFGLGANDYVHNRRQHSLSENDFRTAEIALWETPKQLNSRILDLRLEDRHSLADLIEARAGLVLGKSLEQSQERYDRLLEWKHHPVSVRLRLVEQGAKVRGLRGYAKKSLEDLEDAVCDAPDDKTRVRLLRQLMVSAYCVVSPQHVLVPDQWFRMSQYLEEALTVIDPRSLDYSSWSDGTRIERAVEFDPFLGPGVLIFEAYIRAAQAGQSSTKSLRALEWHRKLVFEQEKTDPMMLGFDMHRWQLRQ